MKKQKVMNQFRKFTFILSLFGFLIAFPILASAQVVKGFAPNAMTSSPSPAIPTMTDPASVNWKTTAEALPIIEQILVQIQDEKSSLTPNTVVAEQVSARHSYYSAVKESLSYGITVSESVQTSRFQTTSPLIDQKFETVTLINEASVLLAN
jgi:hypothetical protein